MLQKLFKFFGEPSAPVPNPDVLMQFGRDVIDFHSAFSGHALIGMTGSGKTSLLELLVQAIAEHPSRPGIVWCAAKSDEADRAEKVARRAGRAADFIRFQADGRHTVDLFGYLRNRLNQSSDGIARFCDRMAGLAAANTGTGDDKTWQIQATLMVTHGLALFEAAGIHPTPQELFDVIISIPKDPKSAASDEFLRSATCGRLILRGYERSKANQLSSAAAAAFTRAVNYFLTYAPGTGDRFLGSVIASAVTGLAPFLQPPFDSLFGSSQTTVPPDALLDGAIIALDFPVAHGPNAYVAQACYVQLSQMLLLQTPQGSRRPVVFVRDECQWLVSPDWDSRLQTIARSHGIISISACQGLSALIDAFGGDEAAKVQALTFLGNHATHWVFNTGPDIETRDHYVQLFGTSRQMLYNGGQQPNPHASNFDRLLGCDFMPTVGWGQQMLPTVPPENFGMLKRGGPQHDYRVQAYLYQAGRQFTSGHPFLRVEVAQNLSP